MEETKITIADSLAEIKSSDWDRLIQKNPTASYDFLRAMEVSNCVGDGTGWYPAHIFAHQENKLIGAMPLYIKSHSYGEYVFDWAWADAYQRSGLDYYPKLLCAIPFTPVGGPRLLTDDVHTKSLLIKSAIQFAEANEFSSFHCLYPAEDEKNSWTQQSMMKRKSFQFHWMNKCYITFDEFLSSMNHQKRKKIRQEREKLRNLGISLETVKGNRASDNEWNFFFKCYQQTYLERGSTPYLNQKFFDLIRSSMGEHILLVFAKFEGNFVASAMNIIGDNVIYGRYWGSTRYIPGLHFEVCYYQAIEYAIKNDIARFEGGAQGEHKLARGLEPVETDSYHWLAHPQFAEAVSSYLERESPAVDNHVGSLQVRSPFKRHL
jgi:predicted N-acyltransferase